MTPTTRPVPNFPGYFASDDGRVYSVRPWRGSTEWRELAGGVNARGYRQVILCVDGSRTVREVHAIIAASNLRYGTRSENELDKVRHRRSRAA